jgi:RNA polymerase subunit RPABC4/transcription elongation factor Spt4
MTIQICPHCKKRGFSWFLDEEVSKDTIWYCSECQYKVMEDEKLETTCPQCNSESLIFLKEDNHSYQYCLLGNHIQLAKN